jgi:hypothetical protein
MKNMKTYVAMIGLAGLASMAGCQAPLPGSAGSLQLFRDNIRVEEQSLANQIGFDKPKVEHQPRGQWKVTTAVTNLGKESQAIEFRYTFTVNKIILESPLAFARKDVAPGAKVELTATSRDALPDAPAGNYLLEIRKARSGS